MTLSTRLKRWLFLIHRWLGIVACLFFAMWFISGVVMMYVGYPKLTERERLLHLPALAAQEALLSPAQALDRAGLHGPLQDLRLANARGGQPVYLVTPEKAPASAGQKRSRGTDVVIVDARTGKRLTDVDQTLAMATARAYAGQDVALQYEGTVMEDAFTHSRALDAHRPLHLVQLADPDHTLLYVSGKTGEVVRDATRNERIWNYAGAWIHWLYPFRGNVFEGWWTDIVIWLSIGGTILALTGTVVGILRWRFTKPYRSGSRSPYQTGMMRWHHIVGLLFAFITITWIFSGLMSMNPWRIFDSAAAPLRTTEMQGGALTLTALDRTPADLLKAADRPISELRWMRSLGDNAVVAYGSVGTPTLLDSQAATPRMIDEQALIAAGSKLLPYPVAKVEKLDRYDLYYYARDPHTMMGGAEKPLPILRLIFSDPYATWVHLDLQTGAVLGKTDSYRRTSRWLFAMLHSWDWLPLLDRRPLWDVLLIVLSLGGAALSITGVIIGWRRLGKKLRAHHH